jgi:spermidine/putrescine-binding protein
MSEHDRRFTRKDLLKGGAVGAAGLYLGGTGSALASRLAASGMSAKETIAWLTWFDHFFPQQLAVTLKKTGIACHPKLAPSDSQIYTTIRTTGSQFDIAAADALWVSKMHKDGLTTSFDLSSIGASKQLYSAARHISIWKDGSNSMAFPNGWSTVQIYYNPKFVKTAPTHYDALLDPKYAKRIAYEDEPESVMAIAGIATRAKVPFNQTIPEIARSKAWLEKLKPNILHLANQNSENITLMKNGDAWIVLGNLGVDTRVRDAGGPMIKTIFPKEGQIGWFDGEQMVKKSTHQDAFMPFINATYSQTAWIAKNFIKNGRPMFNEKAYKILVNQGYKSRLDAFHYNNPDLIFQAHLQGPAKNSQAITDAYNEVFGA